MATYLDAREVVISKFGVASQAHAAVEYARLIDMIEQGYLSSDDLRSEVDEQLRVVHLLIDSAVSAREVDHVTYDPKTEWLHFAETARAQLPPQANPNTLRLTRNALKALPSASHFLYVLSTEGSVLLESTPLTTSDLFFPDTDSVRVRVRHPQLLGPKVPVLGAGEVCVFHSAGSPYAALVNNRSGHFRPPPRSLDRVKRAVCHELSLPAHAVVEVCVGAYRRQ